MFQDDDLIHTVEESSLLQRKYEKYVDMVIVNEDFDITFRKVVEALNALAETYQWVPVNWIYWMQFKKNQHFFLTWKRERQKITNFCLESRRNNKWKIPAYF